MNNQNKKNKMPRFNLNWLYIAIIAGLVFMLFQGKGPFPCGPFLG